MCKKQPILLLAVDPGGSNAVGVLAKALKKNYKTHIFTREAAFLHLKKNFPNLDIDLLPESHCQYSIPQFNELLLKLNPVTVITDTTGRDYSSRSLWQACEHIGIPSIAVLDQWMNYSLRFLQAHNIYQDKSRYQTTELTLPNAIVVMDQEAKSQMINEGIPERIIYPFGSPYYQELLNFSKKNTPKSSKKINILFASEPITAVYGHTLGKRIHGYTEKTILHTLCQIIEAYDFKNKLNISIRPHPRESKHRYNQLLTRYRFLKICRGKTVSESISSHDLIIGMSSTMLLEAVFQNKPILSLQIGNHGSSPFYPEQKGVVRSLRYTFQVKNEIKNIMEHRLKKYQINLGFGDGAVASIINLIKKLQDS